jgi:hypothetical protein
MAEILKHNTSQPSVPPSNGPPLSSKEVSRPTAKTAPHLSSKGVSPPISKEAPCPSSTTTTPLTDKDPTPLLEASPPQEEARTSPPPPAHSAHSADTARFPSPPVSNTEVITIRDDTPLPEELSESETPHQSSLQTDEEPSMTKCSEPGPMTNNKRRWSINQDNRRYPCRLPPPTNCKQRQSDFSTSVQAISNVALVLAEQSTVMKSNHEFLMNRQGQHHTN